jgi:ABC-type uncharacterized transport system permease subunit/basic membrane lipoprotein Med (substrate-binding protein (PBP1-ABC) superfamily)
VARELHVGLITDGPVDDGTYNQGAYEGLVQAAEEYSFKFEVIGTGDPTTYERDLNELIDRGCTHVVAMGSQKGVAVERLAMRRPSVHFIIVDYVPLPESTNVTGLTFAEDEAGFLAGALAGLMTSKEVVGFVGGVDISAVRKFHKGFEHGVAYANRRATVVSTYTGSFTDLDLGQSAARELMGKGADVIFGAAGPSGSAAIRLAAEQGAWVIGVDYDEFATTFQDGHAAGADHLLTSAIKRVDRAVFGALTQAVAGKLQCGTVHFNLVGDGVGLARYHLADAAIPSDVRGKVLEIADRLRSGRLHTGVGPKGEEIVRGLLPRLMVWDWQAILLPFLAIFTALVIGAIFIAAFDPVVWEAFRAGIGAGLAAAWEAISVAYVSLFEGAFGTPSAISQGISTWATTGQSADFVNAIRPILDSLRIATPYVFAGLAVALGFRGGLFNIGAEGQYFIGGICSVFVGYSIQGLPWYIHLPLAILAGMAGGAIWAGIAGFLKAQTGAHEVINTIMLNYIAYRLNDYLLQGGGPMAAPGFRPVSPDIMPSAYLPQFFPNQSAISLNVGLILALAAVVFVYWLLFRTTLGFEIRAVGANPRAARTAGIKPGRIYVLTMALSGALAGMAGTHDILGVVHYLPNAFSAGYGFDSIALALLGRSRPVGVLLASLLFGFLRAGAFRMQGVAHVPIDIISVLQALIIIFIAAPEVIRLIYRLRTPRETAEAVLTRGWGQ